MYDVYAFCGNCGCVQLHVYRQLEDRRYFQCNCCGTAATETEIEEFIQKQMHSEELDRSYDSDKEIS